MKNKRMNQDLGNSDRSFSVISYQQLDTDSGTDKRIHHFPSSGQDTDSDTDKRINNFPSSGQDTDSGTDKRINYFTSSRLDTDKRINHFPSSVHLWQNSCLATCLALLFLPTTLEIFSHNFSIRMFLI